MLLVDSDFNPEQIRRVFPQTSTSEYLEVRTHDTIVVGTPEF